MRLKTAAKSVFALLVLTAYYILEKVFYPVMSNEQALKQMEDTAGSFTDYSLYQLLWHWGWAIPAIICILIFAGEINDLFSKFKGGFRL